MREISKDELKSIIERHQLWLAGDGGERANLRGANLRGINLRHADLRDADLSYSDLRGVDLSYSDLRGANLSGADLSGASLSGANLSYADLRYVYLCGAKSFRFLPVQDPRGYSFAHAIETGEGWRVRAGCRDFSIEEALDHWGGGYNGDRETGDSYLYAVNWLKGWLETVKEEAA